MIAGGTVHGMLGISCITAGNMSEIRTGLHVGLKPEIMNKRIEVNERYSKANAELEDVVTSMAKILRVRQQSGELSEQLQKHLDEFKQKKDEIYSRCMEVKKEADAMEAMVIAAREAKIRVEGNIYHGVVISIDNHDMIINRDTSFMEYQSQNGVITGTVVVI